MKAKTLCHPKAEMSDIFLGDVRVRCSRLRAPKSAAAPLWELIRGARLWTVIESTQRLELPDDPRGLQPPERALLKAAMELGVTLAVNVTPPICVGRLLQRRCFNAKAEYVADGVRTTTEAYDLLKNELAEMVINSLAFVGDLIVLAWSQGWAERWGL